MFEKDIEEFSADKRSKTNGRQPKCKECNREYYKENQEKIITRVKEQYHENNKEILVRRAQLRKRPEAKILKAKQDHDYYLDNKLYLVEYYKSWCEKNKKHLRSYQSVYKFKRLKRIIDNGNNTLTTADVFKLLNTHPYCEYCKSTENLTIDHIIPIVKGGQNSVLNVTVACRSCNSSKNDKLLEEWINED